MPIPNTPIFKSPFIKIFSVLFIVFFIFIFTKGIDVLTRTNSYETPYSGPDTTTEERIKKFVK